MVDFFPTEEEILIDLYNLLLSIEITSVEQKLYKRAIDLIEIEKEYYEAIMFQLTPALAYLARTQGISNLGVKFMNKISRFTNGALSFYLFDTIVRK